MGTKNPIIVMSGGTGVGTSTYALELAKHLDIHNITSSDSIREAFRSQYNKEFYMALFSSTYLVGQTENYAQKPRDVQKSEILRGFKTQARAVSTGIYGVVKRALNENIPTIVEGVHIVPGEIEENGFYHEHGTRFIECCIAINEPSSHKARFQSREESAPERSMQKYLDNFREIRWIHEYLLKKTEDVNNVKVIDNSGSLRSGIDELVQHISHLN